MNLCTHAGPDCCSTTGMDSWREVSPVMPTAAVPMRERQASLSATMFLPRDMSRKSSRGSTSMHSTGFNSTTARANDMSSAGDRSPGTLGSPESKGPIGHAGGWLDGRWQDGALLHVIRGSSIFWADGTATEMEETGHGTFSTILFGTVYHGSVEAGGQVIKWNDGSSWYRTTEQDDIDGQWSQETEMQPQQHAIKANMVYWADGSVTSIVELSPGYYTTMLSGQAYSCHLEPGGQRLRWSDGDTWFRIRQSHVMGWRESLVALQCISAAALLNSLFVYGVCSQLRNPWTKPSASSWPDSQAWQFVLAWACVPFLLIHGVWAAYLAAHGNRDLEASDDGGKSPEVAFLWLLEPMRLAALMHIFWYHEDPEGPQGRWGYVWITFFMTLSGFVGSYQLLMHDPDLTKTTCAGFIWKRIKRLWPLYLLFLFVDAVPNYFSEVLDHGTIFPSPAGAIASLQKLLSPMGLIYILGLQTLIPVDPQFLFVNKTCWFVATLMLCESLLPVWLRGIHSVIQTAQIVGKRPGGTLRRSSEPPKVLSVTLALLALTAALTAFSSAYMAGGKVYLRRHAGLRRSMDLNIFWFLRFSPFCHWTQLLLGAALAKTFVVMQGSGSSGENGSGAQELLPSSPHRSVFPDWSLAGSGLGKSDASASSGCGMCLGLLHLWPWILGLLIVLFTICLALYTGTEDEAGATVIFLNCGGPAVSFASLILGAAQVSYQVPPTAFVKKVCTLVGAVCFPAYLFVPHSERLCWHYMQVLGMSQDASVFWAHKLHIPLIAFAQFCWDQASAFTKRVSANAGPLRCGPVVRCNRFGMNRVR